MHVILVVICLTKFPDVKQKPENGSLGFWIYGQNMFAEKAFTSRGKHDYLNEFGTCIKLIKRNTANSKKTSYSSCNTANLKNFTLIFMKCPIYVYKDIID